MVAAVVREHGFGAITDEVEFLVRAQPEPGARKREGWTRDEFELQHAPVKLATLLDITDVNRDVVQFQNFHLEYRGQETDERRKPQMDTDFRRFIALNGSAE